MPTTDPQLIEKYNQVYEDGEEKFFTYGSRNEQDCILRNVDFIGKDVLEIGCGTGDMASRIVAAGAEFVRAIDESPAAITRALQKYRGMERLSLFAASIDDMIGHDSRIPYDVVVMIGVLEHTEIPAKTLRAIVDHIMASGSILAFSCPCHLNPRGYIWAALQMLFDVPMSLTDKHMISPSWVISQAKRFNLEIVGIETVDQSWGHGRRMIKDFEKRLPKAIPESIWLIKQASMEERIEELLAWLSEGIPYHKGRGANAVYFLRKP